MQTEPALQYVLSNTRHNFHPEVPEPAAVPDIGAMDTGKKEWAVKFIGRIRAPTDGEYVFRAEADAGVRLSIRGVKVFDGWNREGSSSNRIGKIELANDTPADFQLDYWYERSNNFPLSPSQNRREATASLMIL